MASTEKYKFKENIKIKNEPENFEPVYKIQI